MNFTEVSDVLRRERDLIELLHFKLEEERLVLTTGQSSWVERSAREVEAVSEEAHRVEEDRRRIIEAFAGRLGIHGECTLSALRQASPPEWATVFADHQSVMADLVPKVKEAVEANRELLLRGTDSVRQALAGFGREQDPGDEKVYARHGGPSGSARNRACFLDWKV